MRRGSSETWLTWWPAFLGAGLCTLMVFGHFAFQADATTHPLSMTFGATDQHNCDVLLSKVIAANNQIDHGRIVAEGLIAHCPAFAPRHSIWRTKAD